MPLPFHTALLEQLTSVRFSHCSGGYIHATDCLSNGSRHVLNMYHDLVTNQTVDESALPYTFTYADSDAVTHTATGFYANARG